MNEYGKETKSAATETKIQNLYKDFNKKSAGYLNSLYTSILIEKQEL